MASNDKYDRQLRLWGSNGQRALSGSHVVLINASAAGTETLKNLVLPGVGSFHVIDDQTVSCGASNSCRQENISNFFAVPKSEIGDLRSELVCRNLSELNDDVKGTSEQVKSLEEVDYEKLLSTHKREGEEGSLLVIASDLGLRPLLNLAAVCWNHRINLLSVKSYGLVGTVRLQTPYHEIVEVKPDNTVPDLRLANFDPLFPELQSLVDDCDLDGLETMEHAHQPYVFILCKALEKWRDDCSLHPPEQRYPKTFKEKNDFKKLIKAMSRNFYEETNFEEAHKEAYLAYSVREIPEETMDLIIKSESSPEKKSRFNIMLRALKRFLDENKNEPPLNGSIPDMTSTTESYVKLQRAYQCKAKDDFAKMRKIVNSICATMSISEGTAFISDEVLSLFCKNAFNIMLLKNRSLQMEYDSQVVDENREGIQKDKALELQETLSMTLMEQTKFDTPLLWFLAMRACELFEMEHGIYPGADSRELAINADVETVHAKVKDIVGRMGLNDNDVVQKFLVDSKDIVKEMVRYFNAEVHNIASLVGGVASQEAVKLITHQYIPLNNTFVFNGVTSTAGTYEL